MQHPRRNRLASAGPGCEGCSSVGRGPLLPFPTVSSLMLVCRRIGKDLSNTFAKLEKLTICECSRDVLEMGH